MFRLRTTFQLENVASAPPNRRTSEVETRDDLSKRRRPDGLSMILCEHLWGLLRLSVGCDTGRTRLLIVTYFGSNHDAVYVERS